MGWFQSFRVRSKILVCVGLQAIILAIAFMTMFVTQVRKSASDEVLDSARNTLGMAKSVREGMAKKWDVGLFNTKDLLTWADAGQHDRVLAAVPIVTAWEAVMKRAEENGYTLKTPRRGARNSNNEPDPLEARALAAFDADPNLNEFIETDEEANTLRYFQPVRLSQDCMMCHGKPETSVALWNNDKGVDVTGYQMEGARVGDLHGAFEVVQSLDNSDKQVQASINTGLLVLTFVLLPSLGLVSWLVSRYIMRPIQGTIDTLKDIAQGEGDLTKRLNDKSKDELGELAHWFNEFVEKIHRIVSEIASGASTLTTSSSNLSATAGQLSDGAVRSKLQSATVSSAAEELSIGMQNVSSSADEMSSNIRRDTQAVENVKNTIDAISHSAEKSAKVAGKAAELADQSNSRITTLGQSAQEIGKVIEVIEDIAEQTNLLALNATIEAARAGEAGKGFAVVATEVKQLAKQTAAAIEDIRSRIQAIQTSTGAAVESIQAIDKVIGQVNELNRDIARSVEEQSKTTSQIVESITGTAGLADVISRNISESASASREITENMARVDETLGETATGAELSKSAGSQLSLLAGKMQSLVSQFRIKNEDRMAV